MYLQNNVFAEFVTLLIMVGFLIKDSKLTAVNFTLINNVAIFVV